MSVYENYAPIDLSGVKTYELASRPSKVSVKDFAEPVAPDDSIKNFLAGLPNILAVQSLREIARQIRRARRLNKPIIWGLGGHVVKTGLAPVLIDLLRRGYVSAAAANGSVLVHDTEIALAGFTSEDVDASLGQGDFGAARETGEILNQAAKNGARDRIGLGEAMGREIVALDPQNAEVSILCQAYQNKIPFTAHLAIGADIGHFHAAPSAAAFI
jgi:deoxyhypusine synthase